MCLSFSKVYQTSSWNWDGERIIHDSIVPSSRPPVAHRKGNYDIDVREFLVSERNVVMRRTLETDIKKFISELKLPNASWDFFRSRDPGSFDFRANIISEFVSSAIKYLPTNGLDPWQFPEETLSLKSGDCEDRALLIASLLLASGISSFNVRVVLGKFRAWINGERQDFDHVWVMYKNEAGQWQLIEPAHTKQIDKKIEIKNGMPERAEYVPFYLFNDVHLWQAQHPSAYKDPQDLKRDWSSLRPEFAGWVHKSILNEALTPDICPSWVLNALNRHFTSVLWQNKLTIDDPDLPGSYDPRDHFDNGYINESWQIVQGRLQQFGQENLKNLDAFHLAAHAIADFYAHSSYGHFGTVNNGILELFDPNSPDSNLPQKPDYSSGTSFDFKNFSRNININTGTADDAVQHWQGKIISGRYAQKGDSRDVVERITFIPPDLLKDTDFQSRGLLPHHNEIAVDEETPKKEHILYSDDKMYTKQYQLRYDAAVRHIREAFKKQWKP